MPPGMDNEYRPTLIAITMVIRAGIGAEVIVKALGDPVLRHKAGLSSMPQPKCCTYAADLAEFDVFWCAINSTPAPQLSA